MAPVGLYKFYIYFNGNHMSFHIISNLTREYKWDLDFY